MVNRISCFLNNTTKLVGGEVLVGLPPDREETLFEEKYAILSIFISKNPIGTNSTIE